MTDESTLEPQPGSEEPSSEVAPADVTEGEATPRKPFLVHFSRAPIPETDLTIREPSAGQSSAMRTDAYNTELDDREFTVCLVHRQLDQDQAIEDVRAWSDEQLLAAADAYLSLDTGEPDDEVGDGQAQGEEESTDQDDDGQVADADDAEPEPLTFAVFRDEIREQGVRRAEKLKRMMSGILGLSNGAVGSALAGYKLGDAFKGLNLTALKNASGVGALEGLDPAKLSGATGLGALKGIDLTELTGTAKIGSALSKMLADTQSMERFTLPPMERHVPQFPDLEPLPHLMSTERPEVRLLEGVGETLEKMHDDQVRLARDQIVVMTRQGQLIKDQGEALAALVSDAKGQKWSRRTLVWSTVIIAITGIILAFIAGGIVRPFGEASLTTPAPIVSPHASASAAPSLAPTPQSQSTATDLPVALYDDSPFASVGGELRQEA